MVHTKYFTYITTLVHDEHKAEDIIQETLIQMYKNLDNLNQTESFWSWTHQILKGVMSRAHQADQRWRTMKERMTHEPGYAHEMQGTAQAFQHDMVQAIIGAMDNLNIDQSEILKLRFYEGLSFSQIGRKLGCKDFTARMRFLRAKKILLKQLARNGFKYLPVPVVMTIYAGMTMPEAAAAVAMAATVSASAGLLPAIIAVCLSKAAVVGLAIGLTLAAGGYGATKYYDSTSNPEYSSTRISGLFTQYTPCRYIKVEGYLGDKTIKGLGRLPLNENAARTDEFYPWLSLQIGEDRLYFDIDHFEGLPRPWLGLHPFELIRRDLNRRDIWNEPYRSPDQENTLVYAYGRNRTVVYVINRFTQELLQISFMNRNRQIEGQLSFTYLESRDNTINDFLDPGASDALTISFFEYIGL